MLVLNVKEGMPIDKLLTNVITLDTNGTQLYNVCERYNVTDKE